VFKGIKKHGEIKMAEDELLLTSSDVYLKSGIHIGTKFKTKYLENFIYKTRSDGLSVFNVSAIDKRIATAAKFISHYEPEEILVCGRRESDWRAIKLFAKVVGSKVLAERYPPGILTNSKLDNFLEAKVMIVCDPWPDRNAVSDGIKIGIPIVALCDTNNTINNVDLVIPCNNKGKKSLGLLFYLLAREYLLANGRIKSESEMPYSLDDFSE